MICRVIAVKMALGAKSETDSDFFQSLSKRLVKKVVALSKCSDKPAKTAILKQICAVNNDISDRFKSRFLEDIRFHDLEILRLKTLFSTYISDLEDIEKGRISRYDFENRIIALTTEWFLQDQNDSDHSQSSTTSTIYDLKQILFRESSSEGDVLVELNESRNGQRSEGLGFSFRFQPNTSNYSTTRWIQFIARGVMLNGKYQSGINKFGENSYALYLDPYVNFSWNLDKKRIGITPFYDENQTTLPVDHGNIPTFDQPTGWSTRFKFDFCELNNPSSLKTLIESGAEIISEAKFMAYLFNEKTRMVLGRANFSINWKIRSEDIVQVDTDQFKCLVPFSKKQETVEIELDLISSSIDAKAEFNPNIEQVHRDIINKIYPNFFNLLEVIQ